LAKRTFATSDPLSSRREGISKQIIFGKKNKNKSLQPVYLELSIGHGTAAKKSSDTAVLQTIIAVSDAKEQSSGDRCHRIRDCREKKSASA
jgi:hypothetical protein